MTTPNGVHDDARRAITDAAAAVHRASMAVTWAMPGPHEAAAVAEATEYAMAALKGMQRILTGVMDHSSVFPAVSPGRAREVDAAGGVRWGAQNKSGPAGAGNTCSPGPDHLEGVAVGKPTRAPHPAPIGATITIPLSRHSETELGDLRGLLALTECLPDDTLVSVYVPLDPREHGTIAIIVGCEVRA